MINREKLIACCGLGSDGQLRKSHREWVEESIDGARNTRQPEWSESIAVGREKFVRDVLEKLQVRVKGRKVREGGDLYQLREPKAAYNTHFTPENGLLRVENRYYRDD